MLEHEYCLLGGVNRAKIGRYIGTASALVSAGLVFAILTIVDMAKYLGVSVNLPPAILSLVGAGAVFAVLYWVFDKFLWRIGIFKRALSVPDLSGEWSCIGSSLDLNSNPIYEWEGRVNIVQSWDKIRVRLKTAQSGSDSVAAALVYDAAEGYRLLYNYRNQPKITERELSPHIGFADMIFSKDVSVAEGEYFNGRGRITFGTMRWSKV